MLAVLGDSSGGERLAESLDFFEFLDDQTRAMMQRWRERKAGGKARK